MPKADIVTTPTTVNERLPGLARRSFLAGLAVTVPIAATATTSALAAPGTDAELVALSKQLADLVPLREAASDEMGRCQIAEREMMPQYPVAMMWRERDPVSYTNTKIVTEGGQVRFLCNTDEIRKLRGRTFRQWEFIGTREEYERLGMQDFEPHEIKPLMRYEHCFRAKPDEQKTARAKELMAALEEHHANLIAVYEQSGLEAAELGYDEISERMSELFWKIKDLKAETLEGYRAKALAMVLNCWSGEIEPGDNEEEFMLAAICSDLTDIPIKALSAGLGRAEP